MLVLSEHVTTIIFRPNRPIIGSNDHSGKPVGATSVCPIKPIEVLVQVNPFVLFMFAQVNPFVPVLFAQVNMLVLVMFVQVNSLIIVMLVQINLLVPPTLVQIKPSLLQSFP